MLIVKHGVFGSLSANNFLITDEETGESALVDCSSDGSDMRQFIGAAKLKYILLTHGHFDHCDGVPEIAWAYGAEIVIAEGDRHMAADTAANVSALFGSRWKAYTPGRTVSDGDVLPLGKTEISVMATPGHTPGSVCYFTDDCLFTGDTIMVGGVGRTDFPGGSEAVLMDSLEKLLPYTRTRSVYPGHGQIVVR